MHGFKQLIYLAPLLLFLWSADCAASDGVLEINQACAMNGGCFPGDSAGFPVTVTAEAGSTSFLLTSDLFIEEVNVRGVTSNVNSVTLDLNGFTVQGPLSCEGTGSGLECSPNALSGRGISGEFRTTVKNGTVRGFGAFGVIIFDGKVMHVTAIGNNGVGIAAGVNTASPQGSLVSNCIANGNGRGISLSSGIVTESHVNGNRTEGFIIRLGGSLQGSTSMNNGGDGINVGLGTSESGTTKETVSNNTSTNNGGVGIIGGNGVHIRNNLVSENSGNGIQVSKGGLIQGNTVFKNGGHGILVSSSNLVIDNAMRENAGFGLYFVGSQSNYHGNMMSVNTQGNVGGTGTGLNTGLNSCGNSTTCP